jgi:hypothetical protein
LTSIRLIKALSSGSVLFSEITLYSNIREKN